MSVGDLELGDFVLRQLSSFLLGAGAFMASGFCGLVVSGSARKCSSCILSLPCSVSRNRRTVSGASRSYSCAENGDDLDHCRLSTEWSRVFC